MKIKFNNALPINGHAYLILLAMALQWNTLYKAARIVPSSSAARNSFKLPLLTIMLRTRAKRAIFLAPSVNKKLQSEIAFTPNQKRK